jgi:PAS domain S-box-containing protein
MVVQTYWSVPGVFNDMRRLVSYRVLESFPLIALVTIPEAEVYRRANENARIYSAIALTLTTAILIAIGIAAKRERRLSQAASDVMKAQALIKESHDNLTRAEKIAQLGHYKIERIWVHSPGPMACIASWASRPILFHSDISTALELIHPDRPILEKHRSDIIAGLEPPRITLRVVKDVGEITYIECWSKPIRDGNGAVIGIFGTIQDVTIGKQAQETLAQLNQELIDKQYAIDQAVIVGITDVKGRITYANNNFCQISGYARDELLGQNHRILYSGAQSKMFFREMYRQIANGRIWRGEICNKAKNGSLYWVDTIIVPQLGPHGRPITYVPIRIDITSRKPAGGEDFYMPPYLTDRLGNRAALHEKLEEASAAAAASRIILRFSCWTSMDSNISTIRLAMPREISCSRSWRIV